ncbi:hypothetical protein Dsin_002943 [Dipteronia sinensis]|uniref:Uncharacterized protein n=1 Tax=Dipteronia sinensis TaxID=43782 RepID=A0AAE0B719_9ROSI|nr:hypothetical protein Dsin_002943 [Dipteronia sinensis]
MIVLSWNIRGICKVEKMRVVRSLVDLYIPSILFLQETKLKSFDNRVVSALGGSVLSKGVGVDATGLSSGLITLWNEDKFDVSDCVTNSRCIFLIREVIAVKTIIGFCNVYAATVESESKILWDYCSNRELFSDSVGCRRRFQCGS